VSNVKFFTGKRTSEKVLSHRMEFCHQFEDKHCQLNIVCLQVTERIITNRSTNNAAI
jgi:hypothetical protein